MEFYEDCREFIVIILEIHNQKYMFYMQKISEPGSGFVMTFGMRSITLCSTMAHLPRGLPPGCGVLRQFRAQFPLLLLLLEGVEVLG